MSDPSRPGLAGLPLEWVPPPPRWWLVAAAALGVAGDVLFRAEPGAGLGLWLAAVVLAGAGLSRRRGALGGGRAVVIGLGVAAAASLAVRSAPPLQVLAVGLVGVAAGGSLLERPWTAGLTARLAALAATGLSALAGTPFGAVTAPRDAVSGGASGPRRWAVVARGALAATPILLAVGALFVAGDPVFAGYADRVLRAGLDVALSHFSLALLLAWVAGGVVLAIAALRVGDLAPPAGRMAGFAAEAVVALLLVDLLFGVFLGVQAGVLFGGRGFVETTAGVTYAEYARSGFFLLALAAAIALPVALIGDWIVPPTSGHRRTFVGGAYGLLAGIVLVLASAAHRMGLYVDAYGLTEARIYASAFMAWLAIAAVWLAATLARHRTGRFGAGAVAAAYAVFLALVVLDPAGLVVRVNAARATGAGPADFDVRYGTLELGIDAIPALVDAVGRLPTEAGCRVAKYLLDEGGPGLEDDPRSWTVSRWRARRALAGSEPALRRAAGRCPDVPDPPADPGRREGPARGASPTPGEAVPVPGWALPAPVWALPVPGQAPRPTGR